MKNSIGIDIGGTITKIGIVSSEGKCLKKTLLLLINISVLKNMLYQPKILLNNTGYLFYAYILIFYQLY